MKVSRETWFVSNDGSRWQDEAKAVSRDALLVECDAIHDMIGPMAVDNVCRFANGGGYVQQDRVGVARARVALEALSLRELPRLSEWRAIRDGGAHPSWWGRVIDGGCGPIEALWSRLCCIDTQGREWGQPYYATHPNEATVIAWEHTETTSQRNARSATKYNSAAVVGGGA